MNTRTEKRNESQYPRPKTTPTVAQPSTPRLLHARHRAVLRLGHSGLSALAHGGFGFSVCLALSLLASACSSPGPAKGGKALTRPNHGAGLSQTLQQGDGAAQLSKQDQDTVRVRTYTLPAGSRLEESRLQTTSAGDPVTNLQSVFLSASMPVTEREETHARTELGAAQKNTAGELSAKLSSLRGVVLVGLGLFVFGVASLVWPPLKAIIGSVTTSAALALGGVALIILPSLVVGNELLIFAGVALAIGVWFIAHRHGQLRGLVAATQQPPTTVSLSRHPNRRDL